MTCGKGSDSFTLTYGREQIISLKCVGRGQIVSL